MSEVSINRLAYPYFPKPCRYLMKIMMMQQRSWPQLSSHLHQILFNIPPPPFELDNPSRVSQRSLMLNRQSCVLHLITTIIYFVISATTCICNLQSPLKIVWSKFSVVASGQVSSRAGLPRAGGRCVVVSCTVTCHHPGCPEIALTLSAHELSYFS